MKSPSIVSKVEWHSWLMRDFAPLLKHHWFICAAQSRDDILEGPATFDSHLVPALGIHWAHAVTIRLVLEAKSGLYMLLCGLMDVLVKSVHSMNLFLFKWGCKRDVRVEFDQLSDTADPVIVWGLEGVNRPKLESVFAVYYLKFVLSPTFVFLANSGLFFFL